MKPLYTGCITLALASCTSKPDPFLPGFEVDAPSEGQLQFYTPIIPDITPGDDVTYCSYLDFKVPADYDIVGYKGFQSLGGHHNILYAVNGKHDVDTHVCTEDDMTGVHYLGGGGTDATVAADALPDGVVFRVAAGTQIMILSHWINATDQTLSGQTAYNVSIEDPDPNNSPADLFTNVNTMFSVPVGTSIVHTECTMQQDMQMALVGPHAHQYATHMTITNTPANGTAVVVQDIDWSPEDIFNTPLLHFTKDQPFQVHTGDKFAIDCTYNNTTADTITFPTEMCVSYGYFFPADAEMDCVDGVWPTGN